MKAVQFDDYGPPEVLHLVEVETPVAGPGQVQLRVAAASVNPADVKWRSGALRSFTSVPLILPHVVGYDVAGTVLSVGAGVTRCKAGDRIVTALPKDGYAEIAVAEEVSVARLPEGFDFVQAAALPCAALTGVQMVEMAIAPQKGQTVMVTGATGAVGRFALAAALDLGCRVLAAVRPAYFDEARALGAHEVVALGGDGAGMPAFDHVADTVGGADVGKLARHMKPGGKIVTVATTPIAPDGLPVPVTFFAYKREGDRLARIVADIASGKCSMPVVHRLPLAQAAEAHRIFEAGGVGGKIVLEV